MAQVQEASFKKREEAKNHVLLFTCALVPKALASILTSFVLQLAKTVRNCHSFQIRKRLFCLMFLLMFFSPLCRVIAETVTSHSTALCSRRSVCGRPSWEVGVWQHVTAPWPG